jgi:hypothetical protein
MDGSSRVRDSGEVPVPTESPQPLTIRTHPSQRSLQWAGIALFGFGLLLAVSDREWVGVAFMLVFLSLLGLGMYGRFGMWVVVDESGLSFRNIDRKTHRVTWGEIDAFGSEEAEELGRPRVVSGKLKTGSTFTLDVTLGSQSKVDDLLVRLREWLAYSRRAELS